MFAPIPLEDLSTLSDDEYIAYESWLEDQHPEATISDGTCASGLPADFTLPF